MHRTRHIESARQLENWREPGVVEREVAVIGEQCDTAYQWQPEIARQLSNAFRTTQWIDGRRREETTLTVRNEVLGHRPVVATDHLHNGLVSRTKRRSM